MKQILLNIVAEARSFSRKQRLFVIFAMIAGFCIAGEYGVTRPASHALFLTVFSAKALPYLWMATVPVNLAAIYLYNRFLPKIGPLKMWAVNSLSIVFVNFLAGTLFSLWPQYIAIQCIWKDIYILLMFKQLWSLIHNTIPQARAKYLYGFIFAMGTLGSCIGSLVPSLTADILGSERLFLLTLPIYLILFIAYFKAHSKSSITNEAVQREMMANPSASEGFSLISKNRYLAAILLLVVSMQVSAGFMEYRFNAYLETAILDKDLRTSYCGQLFGLMNLLSMILQVFGSFLALHLFGLKKTHFLIPILLLGSALSAWMIPSFAMISFSYVFLKAIDFSLFSVGREMLYLPFGVDEKFRAKAVIDVFAYRSSKALVSLSILALQAIAGAYLLEAANYISVAIFAIWIAIVFFMVRPETHLKQLGS